MFLMVTGNGRLASGLARTLSARGDDVVIVSERIDARYLGPDFDGVTVEGDPADRDVLAKAGIAKADMLVAAASDDLVNAMTAQVARTVFRVPKVVVRMTDPARAEFYAGLGLDTVCPTRAGIEQVMDMIATAPEAAAPGESEGRRGYPGTTAGAAERNGFPRPALKPAGARRSREPGYALLVGGGKVGYHLAATLKAKGWEVGLVEADAARAARIAESLGITVVCGDATEPEILEDAGASEARNVVALTGSDEVNLAVCQLAREAFGVGDTIARVINPANEAVYKALGVEATINTTAAATGTIEKVLPAHGMRLSPIFAGGDVDLAEIGLAEGSPVVGLPVAELSLPRDCLLIAVVRGEAVMFPRGQTVLAPGDRVFALARRDSAEGLDRALRGGRK